MKIYRIAKITIWFPDEPTDENDWKSNKTTISLAAGNSFAVYWLDGYWLDENNFHKHFSHHSFVSCMGLSFIWLRLSGLGHNIFMDNFMGFLMKQFTINTTLSLSLRVMCFILNKFSEKLKFVVTIFLKEMRTKDTIFMGFRKKRGEKKHVNMWTKIEYVSKTWTFHSILVFEVYKEMRVIKFIFISNKCIKWSDSGQWLKY